MNTAPHTHYVEAFAGGLSVLLRKNPEGVSEVANDVNGELSNFWNVLKEPAYFDGFMRRMEATPFSYTEWENAGTTSIEAGCLDRAVAFFIRCRQSMAGRMASFAPLSRTRTRRGMNEQASAWLGAVEGLPEVHARLKRVAILNDRAEKVIPQQDGEQTLFYLDPPYMHETRASKDTYGENEMTPAQHDRLLKVCCAAKGKVMISGYDCELYRQHLGEWTRHEWELPNHSASGDTKRKMTEVLWCNF
jgi:DNA adenine methylase